jgi:uncharacterized membrane protein YfcA
MIVSVSAFIVDVVHASIGMGYGTILASVLLMASFDPHQTVPAVLMHASSVEAHRVNISSFCFCKII